MVISKKLKYRSDSSRSAVDNVLIGSPSTTDPISAVVMYRAGSVYVTGEASDQDHVSLLHTWYLEVKTVEITGFGVFRGC